MVEKDILRVSVLVPIYHPILILRFFIVCFKKKDNKLDFLNNFRNKLLSEEHLYKVHINLYLLEKIFQIDEIYKFNPNELYNHL